jgi:1-acyl-sn-glycerol-3-phosphate acyltransferase
MVGIFPERGIRHGKGSVLFETELPPGTASLIESAGCAVWPAVILGSDQLYAWRAWYRRPRIFVSYGPVLPPGEGDWNHRMKVAFQSLREEIDQRYNLTTDELPVSAQERWGLKN